MQAHKKSSSQQTIGAIKEKLPVEANTERTNRSQTFVEEMIPSMSSLLSSCIQRYRKTESSTNRRKHELRINALTRRSCNHHEDAHHPAKHHENVEAAPVNITCSPCNERCYCTVQVSDAVKNREKRTYVPTWVENHLRPEWRTYFFWPLATPREKKSLPSCFAKAGKSAKERLNFQRNSTASRWARTRHTTVVQWELFKRLFIRGHGTQYGICCDCPSVNCSCLDSQAVTRKQLNQATC